VHSSPIRIVQISDIHLFSLSGQDFLGVDTHLSFQAVLDLLNTKKSIIDMILLTGDLSQDGSIGAYQQVGDLISQFDIPVYCIPGNHDDSDSMGSFFPYKNCSAQRHVILDGWQLILLDSHIQSKVPGFLEKTELNFMEQCLKAYPNHRALVVFHHHPVPVGCEWLDRLGILNADEFWQTIQPYSNVHSVIFGHVHQVSEGKKNNISYYSAPSTCIQFKRNSAPFALEKLPPGYRLIELFSDGSLRTEVCRVANYIGIFDENAKGY
jgi:Icc protein